MKGYRTLIFALVVAVVGVLQAADWASIIPQNQKWTGAVMMGIGIIIAALRAITTSPAGQKDSQ